MESIEQLTQIESCGLKQRAADFTFATQQLFAALAQASVIESKELLKAREIDPSQKRAKPVFRYLRFTFAQQRCCRAFAAPEGETRARIGNSRANAQFRAFAAMNVRSARRHAK